MTTRGIEVYSYGSRYLARAKRVSFMLWEDKALAITNGFTTETYTTASIFDDSEFDSLLASGDLRKVELTNKQRSLVSEAVSRFGLSSAGGLGSGSANKEEIGDALLIDDVMQTIR